ncbi:MAG: 30S ribosomal protein S19 [Methanomassiliicoccales archaeon]|nr:30S ribosomal protein S19 [Methanomassiliicoccales archaeon]NYT15687.1 30S ribosomal protein S19 [Methanomassiliicoccales archaeon]
MAVKMGGTKASRRRARKKKGAITARRKKEFTYRGFTMEELLEMPFDEVVTLMPARIRRTLIRGLNDEQRTTFDKIRDSDGNTIRTHRRDIPIIPQFVGKSVSVYTGKEFRDFEIKPEMIGHYLGEFAPTRGNVRHSGPGVGATRSSKFLPLK